MTRGRFIDLSGQTFGRWTVVKQQGYGSSGARWLCKCRCGNEKEVAGMCLRSGISRSCGCYAKDVQRARLKRDGWTTRTITGISSYVLEHEGEARTIKEWAELKGFNLTCIISRWNRGWPESELLRPTPTMLREKFANPDPQFDITQKMEED